MANSDGNVPIVPIVPPPPAVQPQIPPIAAINNPAAGQINVPHAQAVQGANGGIQLRVEKAKLPEFYGQKDKDSIAAAEFAKRIDWNVAANGWTDKEAYSNFGMALRGSANIWLESMITLQEIEGARARWSIIKPFFKAEFAIQTDDKLILDGLAHMAMKKSENVRDYFGRLNKTNNIIMEGKCQYTLLPPKPVVQANGFLDTAEVDAYYDIRDKAIGKFYLLNLFRAGLPTELKRVLNLQSLHELDLYNAVQLATIESLSREKGKSSSQIFAIEDENENAVDAVTFRQQSPPTNRPMVKTRTSGATAEERPATPTGGILILGGILTNSNLGVIPTETSKFASSAKFPITVRKTVASTSTPCLDTNGHPFWPKINAATDANSGQNPAPIQSIEDFQF
jgi:hypothetical protein